MLAVLLLKELLLPCEAGGAITESWAPGEDKLRLALLVGYATSADADLFARPGRISPLSTLSARGLWIVVRIGDEA